MSSTYCEHGVEVETTVVGQESRCWKCEPPTLEDLREARSEGFEDGIARAAEHVRAHSCVSSCCDAQPSAGEAEALAACIEKLEPGT